MLPNVIMPSEGFAVESDVGATLRALQYRYLNGIYAKDRKDACRKILELIPKDAVVGIGDSTTVRQVWIKDGLRSRGTTVLDGYNHKMVIKSEAEFHERNMMIERSTVCDVYLTGTNAVTLDGRLVNLDSHGNRVAGMIWGHPLVIIVIGKNKIVKDLDEAFHRIRNLIAQPT